MISSTLSRQIPPNGHSTIQLFASASALLFAACFFSAGHNFVPLQKGDSIMAQSVHCDMSHTSYSTISFWHNNHWRIFRNLRICKANISTLGRKSRTPSLWAYYLIAQILPISFALNLFYLNALLALSKSSTSTPPEEQEQHIEPQSSKPPKNNTQNQTRTISFVLIYAGLLTLAPLSAHTALFIPLIFAIRIFLLVPAFTPFDIDVRRKRLLLLLPPVAIWIALLLTSMMRGVEDGLAILRAVNESPAVSALGWDYVLCAVSAGIWWGRVERGRGGRGGTN